MRRPPFLVVWTIALSVITVAVVLVVSEGAAGLRLPPSDPEAAAHNVATVERFNAQREAERRAGEPLAVTRPTGRSLRAMFVGDSLTVGFASTTPGRGYRDLMIAGWAGGGPVEDTDVARSGSTTAEVAALLPPGESAMDVVVVELSTNDYDTGIETLTADYSELLDRIRAQSPDAALVCAGAWGPSARVLASDRVIARACVDHGGRFVALKPLYENSPSLRGPAGVSTTSGAPSDDFHPNDAGHAAIAQKLLELVAVA